MRRMRSTLLALAAVGLAVPGSGASQPRQSWGKANVSLADYRKDAIECGRMGHYVDVSDTPQAKALAKATRRLESADDHGPAQIGEGGVNLSQVSGGPGGVSDVSKAEVDSFAAAARYAASSERIRSGARSEKHIGDLKVAMLRIVERCLVDRGYSRFALTAEQRKALRKLRKGSDQRHAYLHSLASDPIVLEQQAINEA